MKKKIPDPSSLTPHPFRRGFTILELLITIAVIAIIGVFATLNLQGVKGGNDITDTTKQIGALLREAQSDSMAQSQGATWGVYFSNVTSTLPFYALFVGSYSTSTIKGQYPLPSNLAYATSTLASGATESITFSQISGIASASTSINIYIPSQPSQSSTIYISSTGAVTY